MLLKAHEHHFLSILQPIFPTNHRLLQARRRPESKNKRDIEILSSLQPITKLCPPKKQNHIIYMSVYDENKIKEIVV